MAQLHELLAVEGDLKGQRDKIKDETINTFTKKANHFLGGLRTLKMFGVERENEEAGGMERQEIVTTVPEKLKHMTKSFSRFWDAKLQKEATNQEAKADIIIDGKKFIESIPVTFLLSMEEELRQLRKVYDTIPTLQPGVEWVNDQQKGEYYWKTANPITKNKTEKTIEYKIIVPATKEHPAQVKELSQDKPVGVYSTESYSGMLSPAQKSIMIGKLDTLLRAVKKARQRANNQLVEKRTIGEQIFSYIHS